MIWMKVGHAGQGPPGLALYIIICYTVSGPENKKPKNTLSIVVQFLPIPDYTQIYTHFETTPWTLWSQTSPHASLFFEPQVKNTRFDPPLQTHSLGAQAHVSFS